MQSISRQVVRFPYIYRQEIVTQHNGLAPSGVKFRPPRLKVALRDWFLHHRYLLMKKIIRWIGFWY